MSTTQKRSWAELVAEARQLVTEHDATQWALGDLLLEAVPIRRQSDVKPLRQFALEVGQGFNTVRVWRYVANQWPARHRRRASWTAHRWLAAHPQRFKLMTDELTGYEARRLLAADSTSEEPRSTSLSSTDVAEFAASSLIVHADRGHQKVGRTEVEIVDAHAVRSTVYVDFAPSSGPAERFRLIVESLGLVGERP